ncbi:MAG: hypothetical protein UR17_C0001G0766 [Candidatus Woesebacteria bacterium GW2011_GWF1_31_35]|nr:MAG: hypothetical protein UR17_C0001G0766 [Candidatus Woesebacteria bacterium GW2011_GWF1_31_35]HLD89923.1 hypothetical protein [Patescibacteria group bacterium]
MKKNSIIKLLAFFLILILTIFVGIKIFKVPSKNLFFYGIILLCPLTHFLMMKNGHKH